MRVAIIGPGRLGSALGALLAGSGHEIMYAGGSAPAREAAAAQAGLRAQSGSPQEAAAWADVVALTVPFGALADAVKSAGPLDGKILWSCINAPRADMSGLEIGFDTSAAECVAEHAPDAHIVEAIPAFAEVLSSPSRDFGDVTPTVFCCGDDTQAKAVVAELISDLGVDPVDVGPLTAARYVEPAMMLLIALAYSGSHPRTLALKLLER